MIESRFWNRVRIKVSTLFAFLGFMLIGLVGSMIVADSASAHGYIESPASRAVLCKQGLNKNCGQVQYEPQSVEGKGSFPQDGPADGQIASGGVFANLNEQSTDLWHKVTMKGGKNTIKWYLTAPHATSEWKYYITKKDWDPNKPLSRAVLEPIHSINDGGKRPPNNIIHEVILPKDRSGYHLILGVWEIADTGNAFYQVIDVNLVNDDTGIEEPTTGNNPTVPGVPAWEAGKVYYKGDRVQYNGLEYEALYWTQNNKPDSSDAWKLVSNVILEWNRFNAYIGGDKVKHNGIVYEARWWTRGEEPGRAGVWKVVQ
ncbi:MAG: lytic polysaccharide monooxygenase [Virgibacillus proomii]